MSVTLLSSLFSFPPLPLLFLISYPLFLTGYWYPLCVPLPLIFLFFSLSICTLYFRLSYNTFYFIFTNLSNAIVQLFLQIISLFLLLLCPELCEHLSHIDPREGVIPAAVIACAPLMSRDTMPFAVSEEEVS